MNIECETRRENSLMGTSRIYVICLLVLVAGGLYLNSLGNVFTNWDDAMIYSNSEVRSLSWENIRTIFTLKKGGTYQPIRA